MIPMLNGGSNNAAPATAPAPAPAPANDEQKEAPPLHLHPLISTPFDQQVINQISFCLLSS